MTNETVPGPVSLAASLIAIQDNASPSPVVVEDPHRGDFYLGEFFLDWPNGTSFAARWRGEGFPLTEARISWIVSLGMPSSAEAQVLVNGTSVYSFHPATNADARPDPCSALRGQRWHAVSPTNRTPVVAAVSHSYCAQRTGTGSLSTESGWLQPIMVAPMGNLEGQVDTMDSRVFSFSPNPPDESAKP